MKLLLLAALIALAACAPPPPAVQVGPPMCIVQDGAVIREIPCPTDRVSRSQPSTPANFAQEMRSKGIHLGMGRNPVCVTCGETWPCSTEQEARRG